MILLDTHAWVWFVSDPTKLSNAARRAVDAAAKVNAVYISGMSAWEVALLAKRNRLKLTMPVHDWVQKTEMLPYFKFVPVTNSIAVQSVFLPGHLHDDPADRIIIATALSLGVPLVTKDERILKYQHVKTLW